MAARSFMIGRQAAAAVAALSSATILVIPKTTLHAEAPTSETLVKRKPIYDELPLSDATASPSSTPSTSSATETLQPSSRRPTDRLATQISHVRLFLHRGAVASEDWVNATLTRGLKLESSFTQTIASLAPDSSTGERVLPGALYVAVAAMAGSILVRRRSIILRAFTPVAAGIGAGWILLPHTMRNVSNLAWRYEEKVPVIALNHMRVRGAVEQGWKEAQERGRSLGGWSEERIGDARGAVEGWVRKGK